jgi:hypothetical protein
VSYQINTSISFVGIDIGKNLFHVIGLDQRGASVLGQKWSRDQISPVCQYGRRAWSACRPMLPEILCGRKGVDCYSIGLRARAQEPM